MRALPTRLAGLVAIEPVVHGDERGFFCETFRSEWRSELGLTAEDQFVQDNQSRSARGVLRGMHFQLGEGLGKLVRCARGRILDVAVDLRRGSPTYGQWEGVELDEESMRALYVPVGFAHGFCVLSDVADVMYSCSDYYNPDRESGFAYDDPEVGIEWPRGLAFQASPRDRGASPLSHLALTRAGN